MIKGTPELVAQRRETIINACETLYQTMSFRDITLKEIGKAVPFSRPTIYNYFETKEEIFLALLAREYDDWATEMKEIMEKEGTAPAVLCVVCGMTNMAYTREDGVLVVPITALRP